MSRHLSASQFDIHEKHHVRRNDADRVFALLSGDYPKEKIEWVHGLHWSGPKKIPLSKIDWQHQQMWKASHDASHVRHFAEELKHENELKPITAIQRPGEPTDMIPDGHHRALAYKEAGRKYVWGFVGKAHHKIGPWDTLHDYQFKDTDKDEKLRQ